MAFANRDFRVRELRITGNSVPSLIGRELEGLKNIPWLLLGSGKRRGERERLNKDYFGSCQEYR